MGITSTQWGPVLQFEALKFWFYSISVSILIGVYQVLGAQSTPAQRPEHKYKKNGVEQAARTRRLYKQLVIDGCDLLVPGSAVGWIRADPVTVGVASCVSTVLAGHNIWVRVNGGGT